MGNESLQAHLETVPYKDLRGMATRLGLRLRPDQQKAAWIDRMVAGWQQPAQQQQWFQALSLPARAAVGRLLAAVQIPAALFWAEYGSVRQVTAAQHWTPPPWQAPATVSEELYYSGLLCPTPRPLVRAQVVSLPVDVRGLLDGEDTRQETGDRRHETRDTRSVGEALVRSESPASSSPVSLSPVSLSPVSLSPVSLSPVSSSPVSSSPVSLSPVSLSPVSSSPVSLSSPGWPLCHDVGQLLIYLHSQPELHLWHERWLTRPHLIALNRRLLHPVTLPRVPSHRRSPYLRLLIFLATSGELQAHGGLTPKGWAWLAASPVEQLAWLWQSWRHATPEQRKSYGLPDGAIARPWPAPFLHQLHTLTTAPAPIPFTAADLVHGMLRAPDPVAAFWVANFHDLSDLDGVVEQTLAEVLHPLGALTFVEPGAPPAAGAAPPAAFPACGYAMTAVGQALVCGQPPAPFAPPPEERPAVWDDATDTVACWIDLAASPWVGTLHAQAQLACYGRYAVPPTRTHQTFHRYTLTPATLAAAAAAGQGLPALWAALAAVGLALVPAQQQQLQLWHSQGRQLTLTQLPLLRTNTPAQLAALLQQSSLRAAIGELLSPTVALLAGDPVAFARQLQAHGYYAALPPGAQAAGLPDASRAGALWLAGRLYGCLGDQLPLPLPPPFAELDQLLAQLSPVQQATLQAQWLCLQEQLLQLLDNLPFTPPPQPSDPAQWRPAITQAIDAKQLLQLTYFSAGRNLTTQRLVEPYWVEEQRGIPYLRAYCHNAGRVLTFRLDRIAALEPALVD